MFRGGSWHFPLTTTHSGSTDTVASYLWALEWGLCCRRFVSLFSEMMKVNIRTLLDKIHNSYLCVKIMWQSLSHRQLKSSTPPFGSVCSSLKADLCRLTKRNSSIVDVLVFLETPSPLIWISKWPLYENTGKKKHLNTVYLECIKLEYWIAPRKCITRQSW